MKIKEYKKKKSNIYEIIFDNKERIDLFDDVILKYELLLKKEINKKELIKIIEENNKIESYNVALKYLKTKLRTKKEITKKLCNYSKDAIYYTIDRLTNEGYLNDLLYIKSYINDEIKFKVVGPSKILFNLKKLGFKESDIINYLGTLEENLWQEKIDKYISKKINSNHKLSGFALKQKLIQDLLSKGFYHEDINEVLTNHSFDDDAKIYENEYEKLKKKYSKKYPDDELDYRIKMALQRKGFYK